MQHQAADLSVPLQTASPLVLTSGSDRLTLALPNVGARSTATASNGNRVRRGTGSTDLVIAQLADGAQVTSVLRSAPAAGALRYQFPGMALAPQPDGSVLIKDGQRTVGLIEVPWATDSKGKDLATSYSVNGDALVQNVDTTGAVFPVAADPSISIGWFIYVRYSKQEVHTAMWSVNSQETFGSVICVVAAEIPWLAAACIAGIGRYMSSIADTWRGADRNNQCMELRYWGTELVGWRAYNC
jgi:hypothetical protein